MPTVEELRDRVTKARRASNSAERAIKDLADLRVPDGAHGARRDLIERIHKIDRAEEKRIKEIRKRIEEKRERGEAGPDAAVKWALEQVGVTESPYGSNAGPFPISECQEFCIGYDGVAWCGCFVDYAAVKVGGAKIPNHSRLAYTPYIDADAGSGSNGLREVSVNDAAKGDLVVFNFGSGGAKHVGLCIAPTSGGLVTCVEGNTSSGSSGDQANGGGVFQRQRPVSHVICIARPDY